MRATPLFRKLIKNFWPRCHCRRKGSFVLFWGLLGLASLFLSIVLSKEQDLPLVSSPTLQVEIYGEIDTTAMQEVAAGRAVQRIKQENNVISADYGFVNFKNSPLQINFSISSKDLATYQGTYGYTQADLDEIEAWQKDALAEAYKQAVNAGWGQKRLDTVSLAIQSDFRKKQIELFANRGFRLRNDNVLIADISKIVEKNIRPLQGVALQFNQIATDHGYDSLETVASVLSMVQTALHYHEIPVKEGGRTTGGVNPPLVAMVEGGGDCDSKSALLASILRNWDQIKLIGVSVPNHYLLGVLQNPAKGQVYVEYRGLRYVLLEPAGPAWLPPGIVAESTLNLLSAGDGPHYEAL